MGLREGVSAKIGNYKCFREPQGFEEILPINVIIGRNNSGKSSLLDLIEFAVDGHLPPVERGHRGSRPEIIYGCKLNSGVVAEVFNKSIGDDIIIDFNKYVNDNMIGCIVEWSPTTGKETLVKNFRRGDNKFFNIDSVDKRVVDKIAITLSNAEAAHSVDFTSGGYWPTGTSGARMTRTTKTASTFDPTVPTRLT